VERTQRERIDVVRRERRYRRRKAERWPDDERCEQNDARDHAGMGDASNAYC
jgi:hypothetical protein